ncbi:putative mRNA guanylyltransferase [Naematelia encephala]|uniref:mRNA-capping enzyme subunit alpha n=1 Tax=Naematelia encephala TaxID=71784 RepID=A0A1Y2AT64_9TREE|nr:putative mRNA guanylyltransferase [Naematelia encephala]
MPHTPIPNIPGVLLTDPTTKQHLSSHVSSLCGLSSNKFPGAQPVSFSAQSLDLLETMDFWVCEKSDGIRLLIFVVMNGMTGNQEVWLIDRKQQFYQVDNLHFPHWERASDPLTDTVLDGELVIDIDPKTGTQVLRYYAFDCLVLNGDNIMKKTLISRFGRLREWVVKPFERALRDLPEWRDNLPFEVVAKKQELSYNISQVLNVHIPQLQHGHDGLIFTCAESEYFPGTDEKILKWKPPSENSIDFKIELRFPPSNNPKEPDFFAKPEFLLHTWLGGNAHEYFDEMDISDEEWDEIKQSGEQLDDRIVEVCWDADRGTWKILRMRDDKPNANHKDIMYKIIASIQDGVEIDALISRSEAIRTAWKAREAARRGTAPPAQQVKRPPPAQVPMPPTPGARGSVGPGSGLPPTPSGAPAGVMAGLKR